MGTSSSSCSGREAFNTRNAVIVTGWGDINGIYQLKSRVAVPRYTEQRIFFGRPGPGGGPSETLRPRSRHAEEIEGIEIDTDRPLVEARELRKEVAALRADLGPAAGRRGFRLGGRSAASETMEPTARATAPSAISMDYN